MPTATLEPPVTRPVLATTTVKSVWATTPPITHHPFSLPAWANAAEMRIPEGVLLVKNDDKFLYLLLDLTRDTGNSPGVGDYFWLTFDVDSDACITPNRDVNYGTWPCLPIRIGKQFCLGPGVWTFLSTDPTQSLARQQFGPTPHSRTPHRIWELRIDLKEISVDLTKVTVPPVLHFGLRVSSTSPQFTSDFPPNFYMDFSHLPEILLAVNAPLPSLGKPVVAVGIIPVGTGQPNTDGIDPTTGRATTASTYYLPAKNAAFGGAVNLIGDDAVLRNLPHGSKYGVTLDGKALLQSWTNYHHTNNHWVYEYFAPDADGRYALIDPVETYSIDHLLFQWNTIGVPTGTHDLEIAFFNPSGTVVETQKLRLMIDNTLPAVDIIEIKYNNQFVQPCDIVNIVPNGGLVKVHYRAYDYAGDMRKFGLTAYHGEGVADSLLVQDPAVDPHGTPDAWVDAPATFPSVSCAYQFRLWAYPNVINGYAFLGYTEATDHVTFVVPNAPRYKVLATKPVLPFGVTSTDGKTGKLTG